MQKQELLDRPDIQSVAVNQQPVEPEWDLLQFFPSRVAGKVIQLSADITAGKLANEKKRNEWQSRAIHLTSLNAHLCL